MDHIMGCRPHPFLQERWNQGCHNAAQLWREIQGQGYGGSYTAVKDWIRTLRFPISCAERRTRAPDTRVPTARTMAWLLLCDEEQLDSQQRQLVERLMEGSPPISAARELARRFLALVRERRARELEAWIAMVESSGLWEFRNFARGLLRDKSAVMAGLSLEWSNGQIEGQVNRLKLIKRQMYGSASFALLRARVLATA
jgi:transposase